LPTLTVVQLHPVVHLIVLVSIVLHGRCEQFSQEVVIGRLIKGKFSHVIEVNSKFLRVALDQLRNRSRLFLFSNLFVLLFVGSRLETLPRKSAAEEVEEDVTKRFEIVTTRLF